LVESRFALSLNLAAHIPQLLASASWELKSSQ
jgi:hypothetical protein